MTAFERAEILEKAASILRDKADEAVRIIALESAKPIAFAKAEVARTIETYKFSAEEVKRIHGETIPFDAAESSTGRFGYTVRELIGVIGAITPFNFIHQKSPTSVSGEMNAY
nr:aldehyde dehydrogenase family protein [Siminovitchia terrae]